MSALIISAPDTSIRVVVFYQILYKPLVPLFHFVGLFFGSQLVQHYLPVGFLEVVYDETCVKDISAESFPSWVFGVTQYDGILAVIVDIEVTCLGIEAAKVQVDTFVCW